jgi:DNA-binding transcriptional ArsR family regulator
MHAFAALADPTRRRIIELLAAGERPAGEIAGEFDVTAQAISQHLNVLKAAGLVRVRADAQRRLYAVDDAGLTEIDTWLAGVRKFWSGRLDELEQSYRAQRKKTAAKRPATKAPRSRK